jgi:methylphosphotriester-DNA--protein-cysteine methyltransferase
MRLIADGVVDREGVKGLARQLCYTERYLHRMLVVEVGAGPIALAERWRPWRACAVQHLWAAQNQMPMIERPATRKEVVA